MGLWGCLCKQGFPQKQIFPSGARSPDRAIPRKPGTPGGMACTGVQAPQGVLSTEEGRTYVSALFPHAPGGWFISSVIYRFPYTAS